jgi:N-acetylated-alpha-linked acidic dipeptidase
VIEGILKSFREMGLAAERHDIWPLLCRPIAAELEIVAPEIVKFDLREKPVAGDSAAEDPDVSFAWNAFSGSGDVSGGVVYANYGTKEDFARLAEAGVDCHGKVVLARYGGNYRGYKARFAEAAGAAGLVIFTDPADSGYTKGGVYPVGGYANDCCVQRGSLVTMPYQGDALTEGIEATKDAKKIPESQADLPRIPVQPVGYGVAKEILSRMTGRGLPEEWAKTWQGGLPFSYHLEGGDALRVRLKVEQRREVAKTSNVIATILGEVEPDRLVVVGCHHDAWVNGAADPTCGTISLLEAARCFAELARTGWRPRRTIVFAAWSAEEFGIIGSTEWVERNEARLRDNGVAYINLDMSAMGPNFACSTSPALRAVILDAIVDVPRARDSAQKSVLAGWMESAKIEAGADMPFGSMGGGSDHVAFLCRTGVPSCGFGGNGSQGWSYHSAYDSLTWYWKVVGDDYEPAKMITRVTCATVLRLADCALVPLDHAEAAKAVAARLKKLRTESTGWASGSGSGDSSIASEIEAVELFAASVEERAARAQVAVVAGLHRGANARVVAMNGVWLDDRGLPGRPWYLNTFESSDEDSGYSPWVLPRVTRGIQRKDVVETREALADLKMRLERLAAGMELLLVR